MARCSTPSSTDTGRQEGAVGRDEDLPKVAAVVSDGLECLEMWVRLAGSNDFFAWNSLFCQVAVVGGMLRMSKKYIRLQEKNILMRLGREAGKKSF